MVEDVLSRRDADSGTVPSEEGTGEVAMPADG